MKAVSNPLTALLARMHGFRMRVAADPSFPFKLLMEETVGLSLAASGMVAARGDKIWEELDFAICDIAVGGALNFILVYLLSPVHGASASGYVGTLPANAFSTGAYTLAQRLAGFLYRGVLFAACGFGGSVVGTGLSQALIYGRRGVAKMKGVEMGVQKKLPNVVANSFAWAGFMLVSANPRYQSVAGVERVLYGFGNGWGKIGSAVLRTANNVAGGANWVVWAKFIGLQECGDEDDDAGESKEK